MGRPSTRRDWDQIAETLKKRPGEWILFFQDEKTTYVSAVYKQEVAAFNEMGGTVEVASRHKYIAEDGLEYGNGWLRWTPAGQKKKQKGPNLDDLGVSFEPKESRVKAISIRVDVESGQRLEDMLSAAGVSVRQYINELARTIIREGTTFKGRRKGPQKVLNGSLPEEDLLALKAVATSANGSINEVFRHEIERRFGDAGPGE